MTENAFSKHKVKGWCFTYFYAQLGNNWVFMGIKILKPKFDIVMPITNGWC